MEDIIPCFTDPSIIKIWAPGFGGMKVLTDGPIRIGTRFNQSWSLNGHKVNINLEITEYHFPDLISFSCHAPKYDFYGTIKIGNVLRGTSIYIYSKLVLKTWMNKLFGFARQNEFNDANEQIYLRLKKYLEHRKRIK